jgi:hypothetical protein
MRRVRSCLWLSVFVLGAALPAFCQGIVPPNTSGFRISELSTKAMFRETVYSTGPYDFFLSVFQNNQQIYAVGGTVCTTGPLTTLSIPVSFALIGLKAGDNIIFMLWVRHRTTEGGTTSLAVSVIPVGSDCGSPPPEPPPTTTTSSKLPPADASRWARREESLFG